MAKPRLFKGDFIGGFQLIEKASKDSWLCKAPECGHESVKSLQSMRQSKTGMCKTCSDSIRKSQTVVDRHGPTFVSYTSMKNRCTNPNGPKYADYGGRGISIDKDWLASYDNFLRDMGERPEGTTLNRKNVNGNYCKANCEWASINKQAYDKRVYKSSKTGKAGVTYNESTGRYHANISFEGIKIFLGSYMTQDQAVKARETAEIEYYGSIKHEGDK